MYQHRSTTGMIYDYITKRNEAEENIIKEMNNLLRDDKIDYDLKKIIIKNNLKKLDGFYTLVKTYYGTKEVYELKPIN